MKELQSEALIQVAGIIDSAEARMFIESGVTHLGFPLRLTVHKEDISAEEAGRIIRSLKPPYVGVLITYLKRTEDILTFCHQLCRKLHSQTGRLGQMKKYVHIYVIVDF